MSALATAPRPFRHALRHPWVGGAVGIMLFLVIWAAASTVLTSSSIVPTPWETVASVVQEFGAFYGPNLLATLERAGLGFVAGNAIGLAVAALVVFVPALEGVLTQLGVITQCIPVTAIGPILILLVGGYDTSVILAALLVVFTTLVAAILGLRAVDRTTVDMVHAFRGGPVALFTKVRIHTALPVVITALAVAVPAAMLGSVVGEFLGGLDTGVGVGLIAAQREQMPERVWGMSVLVGLVALAGYGLVHLVGRAATPWRRVGRSAR